VIRQRARDLGVILPPVLVLSAVASERLRWMRGFLERLGGEERQNVDQFGLLEQAMSVGVRVLAGFGVAVKGIGSRSAT
jgi:hypothetical protein